MQGRAPRVLLEQRKRFIRPFSDGLRQRAVSTPKRRGGVMVQIFVARPASKSRVAASANLSSLPEAASASICRPQVAASKRSYHRRNSPILQRSTAESLPQQAQPWSWAAFIITPHREHARLHRRTLRFHTGLMNRAGLLACLIGCPSIALAQSESAFLSGYVSDTSEASIWDACLILRSDSKEYTAATNQRGLFEFPSLPPGK